MAWLVRRHGDYIWQRQHLLQRIAVHGAVEDHAMSLLSFLGMGSAWTDERGLVMGETRNETQQLADSFRVEAQQHLATISTLSSHVPCFAKPPKPRFLMSLLAASLPVGGGPRVLGRRKVGID